jgi:hypothetical protein
MEDQTIFDNNWDADIIEDITPSFESLVVYSRDWTVETIVTQINKGNIDLNPKFQRRNAWNDGKRSKLIESLILSIPVPEIVLAEDPVKKKSFIVIDGKQRLLSIAGFIDPEIQYWEKPSLSGLKTIKDLNGIDYETLKSNENFEDIERSLLNSDIRCTIISNYTNNDVLYDIFYRLNTGSVPLSSQELRQVLNKGHFADFLIQATEAVLPIHKILKLSEPDKRLRDVEIILLFLSIELFAVHYRGNLKIFLDSSMEKVTIDWENIKNDVFSIFDHFNKTSEYLLNIFPKNKVGRKFVNDKWEGRFNKTLFQVEAFYFSRIPSENFTPQANDIFIKGFKSLCENPDFRSTIEATTKSLENYRTRFTMMQELVNNAYNLQIEEIPVKP